MEEVVYVVAGWAQDMCDDNGIPEICVFTDLGKAKRYELLLCDQGFQNTYIYKRNVGEALPVGWETYDIVDFEEIRQKINEALRKARNNYGEGWR